MAIEEMCRFVKLEAFCTGDKAPRKLIDKVNSRTRRRTQCFLKKNKRLWNLFFKNLCNDTLNGELRYRDGLLYLFKTKPDR